MNKKNIVTVPYRRVVRMGLCVLPLLTPLTLLAADTDGDGLSDEVEATLQTDPEYWDSNMNGLSDFFEARQAGRVGADGQLATSAPLRALALNATSLDTDNDGIPSFLEAYGFFYDGDGIGADVYVPVEHFMSLDQWQALCDRTDAKYPPPAGMDSPFAVACNAIVAGHYYQRPLTLNGESGFALQTYNLLAVIQDAFVAYYGDRGYADGLTNDAGSAAYILREISRAALVDHHDDGNRIEYFFTNPETEFSDFDPIADGVEVRGGTNSQQIAAPANHPYVATYPQLNIELTGYRLRLKNTITDSNGEVSSTDWSSTVSKSEETTHTTSQSNTLEVSATVEASASLMDFGVSTSLTTTASTTTTTENSYTTGTTVDTTNGGALAVEWQTATTTDQACAASLLLSMRLTNDGTAPIDVQAFRHTVLLGDARLPTEQSIALTPLNAGGQSSLQTFEIDCIAFDELRYLQNGGKLRLQTELVAGVIKVFSDSTRQYEDSAEWGSYLNAIERNSALLDLNLLDHEGNRLARKHHVMANTGSNASQQARYKQFALRDALMATLDYDPHYPELAACSTDASGTPVGDVLCRDEGGYIQSRTVERTTTSGMPWKQTLYVGILPRNADGRLPAQGDGSIDFAAINTAVQASLDRVGENQSVLDLPLEPAWEYHLVVPSQPTPSVDSVVVTSSPAALGSATLHVVAHDEVGLSGVALCQSDAGCTALSAHGARDLFSATVDLEATGYGAETVVATNTRIDPYASAPDTLYTAVSNAVAPQLKALRQTHWQRERATLNSTYASYVGYRNELNSIINNASLYDAAYISQVTALRDTLNTYLNSLNSAVQCASDGTGSSFHTCLTRRDNAATLAVDTATITSILNAGSVATFYENVDYNGRQLSLRPGLYTNLSAYNFNDILSSVKVKAGYYVVAFEHGNFMGSRWEYSGNQTGVLRLYNPFTNTYITLASDILSGRDKVSSLAIFKGDKVTENGYATLFEHNNRGGRQMNLGAGLWDIATFNNNSFNDLASSISMPGGFRAFAFKDSGFNGRLGEYNNYTDALSSRGHNDMISSMYVLKSFDNAAIQASNNLYLVAENDGGNNVNGNRGSIGPWERFNIVQLSTSYHCIKSGSTVAISTGNGHFLRAVDNGDLDARAGNIGPWEKFEFINHSDKFGCLARGDEISLRSIAHNRYVWSGSGNARASSTYIGGGERFRIR